MGSQSSIATQQIYEPNIDFLKDTLSTLLGDVFYFRLFSQYLENSSLDIPAPVCNSLHEHFCYFEQHVSDLQYIVGYIDRGDCMRLD